MMDKNEAGKVDKGFELIYWKLSYRRKFIRTLWAIPFAILTIILVSWFYQSIVTTFIFAMIILIVGIAQLIYTYKKWKKHMNVTV